MLGGGNCNLLQYSCLGNSINGGAWWATVHGISKSQTWLSIADHKAFWLTFFFIWYQDIANPSILIVSTCLYLFVLINFCLCWSFCFSYVVCMHHVIRSCSVVQDIDNLFFFSFNRSFDSIIFVNMTDRFVLNSFITF